MDIFTGIIIFLNFAVAAKLVWEIRKQRATITYLIKQVAIERYWRNQYFTLAGDLQRELDLTLISQQKKEQK